MAKNKITRGIRNNNPGNIVRNNIPWTGLCKNQTDKRFCQFSSIYYGVRALVIVLRTYYNKYNCNTIRKVVSRYAPSNENDTENYINFVSDFYCLSPDTKLSLSMCLCLALPIMRFESDFFMSSAELHTIIDKYNLCKSDIF